MGWHYYTTVLLENKLHVKMFLFRDFRDNFNILQSYFCDRVLTYGRDQMLGTCDVNECSMGLAGEMNTSTCID